MPALTISAIDHTTGELTSTAHGLTTGAGPAVLYPYAAGVVPTGLASLTNYWAIVVDANTLELASSSANALANTPVSFSSNGTLPLDLLIGIPYCRATTYAPGSQVKSADLNAIQDSLANPKRVGKVRKLPVSLGNGTPAPGGTVTTAGKWIATSTSSTLVIPIQLQEGERLTAATLRYECSATDVLKVTVYSQVDGTGTSLGTATSADHSGTAQSLTPSVTPTTCSSSDHATYLALVECTAFGSAPTAFGLEVTTDVL